MVLLAIVVSFGQGGCLYYFENRDSGDYYNTTKQVWGKQFYVHDAWYGEWGGLGQSVGYSGIFCFGCGVYFTMPVGLVIYPIEHITLAPLYDTLLLPIDFCHRDKYLSKVEAREVELEARKRAWEEKQAAKNKK